MFRITFISLTLILVSCGGVNKEYEQSEPKGILDGFIVQGANSVWSLLIGQTDLPSITMFSAFPSEQTLTEGTWFENCEKFEERTLLGFKSFDADLCISGYSNINQKIADEFGDSFVVHSGYYLRDIRVKLKVNDIDPVWSVAGQGSFGEVYLKESSPSVPAVDIYIDFSLDSLVGLYKTYSRHYVLDGRGKLEPR